MCELILALLVCGMPVATVCCVSPANCCTVFQTKQPTVARSGISCRGIWEIHRQTSLQTSGFADSESLLITFRAIIKSQFSIIDFGKLTSARVGQWPFHELTDSKLVCWRIAWWRCRNADSYCQKLSQ